LKKLFAFNNSPDRITLENHNRIVTAGHLFFLLFITWTAYYGMLSHYFLSDDFNLLLGSSNWLNPLEGYFRPVPHLLISFLFKLFGTATAPYHILSILFHFANASLVYLLINKLISSRSFALAGASLFAVNFLISEAVFWISSITTLAVTLFYLLGLYLYIYYLEKPKPSSYALVIIVYILGLMSKENAVTFPFLLLTIDIYYSYKKEKRVAILRGLKRTLPFFLLTGFYLVLKVHSLSAAMARESLSLGYHNYRNVRHLLISFFTFSVFHDLPFVFIDIAMINLFADTPITQLNLTMDLKGFYTPLLLGSAILLFCIYLLIKGKPKIKWALVSIFISMGPFIFIGSHHKTFGGYFLYPLRLYYLPAAFFFIFFSLLLFHGVQMINKERTGFNPVVALALAVFALLFITDIAKTIKRSHDWKLAGEIAQSYVKQVEPFTTESKDLVLFGVPDNIKGAYIFRNGVQSAVKLLYPRFTGEINISMDSVENFLSRRGSQILEDKILLNFVDGKILRIQ